MKSIKREAIIEFEEKKSKFIGYIKPVSTITEAERFIGSIKKYILQRLIMSHFTEL